MKLISGTSNPTLSKAIAFELGLQLTDVNIRRFADDEIFVEVKETVRGEDVFVIQSTSSPANDNLMELLILIDALKRASAKRITAVIPYYGYGRQDRKTHPRTPITAKLVANMLTTAGADRILAVDLHAAQIVGYFDIPVDHLTGLGTIAKAFREKPVIVSPDVGGVRRARLFAEILDSDLAIIDKRRHDAGKSEVMHVIGNVKGRECVLIDDIADSGGTLITAAKALLDEGATKVSAAVTHGVLSGAAIDRIQNSLLENLVITDTIAATESVRSASKIRCVSIAPLLAQAIEKIANNRSVSSLFA